MESLAQEDPLSLKIPRRQMVQPSTKLKDLGIKAAPGNFVDKDNKAVFASMDVVVLRSTKSRLLMPPFGSKDNKPRCYSEDGLRPSSRVEHPLSPTGLCRDCEFAKEDDQTNLLCLDVKLTEETGQPHVFWFTAKKSSLNITRQFLDSFRKRGKRPVDHIVTMTAEPGKSDKGNFVVVVFGDERPVPEDFKRQVATAWHMYSQHASSDEELEQANKPQEDEVPF